VKKLDSSERNKILQAHINQFLPKGYRVLSQTESTAQLVKPKQVSFVALILSCLVFGFLFGWWGVLGALIGWFISYVAQKESQVYLQVGDNGQVSRSVSGNILGADLPNLPKTDERALSQWLCVDCGYRLLYTDSECPRCKSPRRKWGG
jgi:hypothetical protein